MRTFDAGTLQNASTGGQPKQLRYHVTVHGPVQGTVMVKGKPYAIAKARSTYGEDASGLAALRDMTLGEGSTVNGFYRAANEFGFTFNWAYASRGHVAYFSSGKLPIRAKGTNKLLPTLGTGKYDWKGFLPLAGTRSRRPGGGLILNWNNKPAPGWQAGEDNLSYGSVHRVEAFDHFPQKARIEDVVSIMNKAATEDVTATQVWPVIRRRAGHGPAPSDRAKLADQLVTAWAAAARRALDADLDGKIDDPGAADPRPGLHEDGHGGAGRADRAADGDLATSRAPTDPQGRNGSSFGGGWYGYVDKDLRALLGRKVHGRVRAVLLRPRVAGARAALGCGPRSTRPRASSPHAGPRPAPWRADATKSASSSPPA